MQSPKPYLITALCWSAIVLLWLGGKLVMGPGSPWAAETVDERILLWFSTLRSPLLDRFFRSITWAGSNVMLLPLTMALAAGLMAKQRAGGAIFLLLATLGVIPLTQLGKHLVSRPRPHLLPAALDLPSGFSFPSAHAAQIVAFVLAATLVLQSCQGRGWLLLATNLLGGTLIALVCLSRLYLAVHYPSDVLAGMLTAGLWVWGLAQLPQLSPRTGTSPPVELKGMFASSP